MTRAKVPHYCEHGGLYVYVHGLKRAESKGGRSRKPMKRTQPKRDWGDAREKVEQEGRCRVCGASRNLQAAHIIGRKHDEFLLGSKTTLYVDPKRIVPLCGPFTGFDSPPFRAGCHADYDSHALDLLPYLTPEEQAQAVLDAGGIEAARRRIDPFAFKPLESPDQHREAALTGSDERSPS